MKRWIALATLLVIGLLVGGLIWYQATRPESKPTSTTDETTIPPVTAEPSAPSTSSEPEFRRLYAAQIEGVGSAFRWSAEVPSDWQAEWVVEIESINLFDPSIEADSNREKSQIFIRSFSANQFLTLKTVKIHERSETTINDRPAVRYDIEKKTGVADFPNQPSWRSARHIVTDVRVSDDNPSTFYVIAKRPDLDQTIYDRFLETLKVVDEPTIQATSVVEPVDGFLNRITKKPYGLHVTPTNSPVSPERFSGYHTGADAEFDGVSTEVEVRAITDGTVKRSSTADGYGGVVVIEHVIEGTTYQVVYGHLDPSNLPAVGATVTQGERIGRLGEGGTAETDGERKHLHLGVYKGSAPNLRGYAASESELDSWLDPTTLFD